MDAMLIPVFGMMIPIVIVPTALAMRQARLARELEHKERIKALELGRILPKDESWWSPPRMCMGIGGGVPLGTFLTAWLASESLGYQEGIWVGATAVGLAGVVGGTILASRYFAQRERAQGPVNAFAKTSVDEDAYDVVGRRG